MDPTHRMQDRCVVLPSKVPADFHQRSGRQLPSEVHRDLPRKYDDGTVGSHVQLLMK
jgi:hypothetical protein